MFSDSKCSISKSKLYRTEESSSLKQKALTLILSFLIISAFILTSGLQVRAQSPGLSIQGFALQANGQSIAVTHVAEAITMNGYINTQNGAYKVFFDDKLVDSGNAQGDVVVSNFTVPELPQSQYNVKLLDVSQGLNATYPIPLLVSFSIQPILPSAPAQLQESSPLVLNVTIFGGKPDMQIDAEILIVPPQPIATNYTRSVPMTGSALGTAQALVSFPDANFSPSGGSNAYVGTYTAFFNATEQLAQSSFTIGFTDLTQYHRQDTVKINATGYQPSQVCSIAVQVNNAILFNQTVTASGQGAVATTWLIPTDAPVGTYTVAITPITTPSKSLADVQAIMIAGYPVAFKALNLADEVVPQIVIEVVDQATSILYSEKTGATGIATVSLEKGSANVTAYWNDVKVGEMQISVTGNSSYTISCQLTDLKVKVQDKNGVIVPFTDLNLTYQYTTHTGTKQNGSLSGQTDISGVYSLNSILPGISYSVAASKYGAVFNAGNDTISNLLAQPFSLATVICPDESLTLNTVDYNNAVLPNARITLIEQASGIFYSVTTDNNGAAQIQVTFGQYRAKVYTADNILLNDTVISVLSNIQKTIQCVEYNLQVSVRVVDYFGTPISNVNVQLNRPGMIPKSGITQGNGIAMFTNVLGGSIEITAYPAGSQNSYAAANLVVDSPKTVTIAMDKYVVFGGLLVEASVLATILLIAIAVVLLVLLEVYRRTGFRMSRNRSN
jgi:hypothetical protein